MPSMIVLFTGDDTTLHVSKLEPAEAAQKIADHFEGYSTDNETILVCLTHEPDLPNGKHLTVLMSSPVGGGSNGGGSTSNLAWVLEFGPEEVAWVLKLEHCDNTDEAETLKDAGALG